MKAGVSGLFGAILYGALALCATPAGAGDLSAGQIEALKAARAGDMEKLIIHDAPKPRLETAFEDGIGARVTIADFVGEATGKVILLDFWAIWCPPCVEEMPALDRLKAEMGGDDFDVVAVSMDRAGVEKIEAFYDKVGIENLGIFREPSLRIGSEAGVLGMPTTLVLDREGRELARLMGGAEWDSEEAKTLLKAIIAAVDEAES